MMKKWMILVVAVCLLLAGCGKANQKADADAGKEPGVETSPSTSVNAEQNVPGVIVQPLPDTTMDNLNDGILSVSLEEGDAYVDDTGVMQMDVKIFAYDRFDMAAISDLKAGDTIVTHAGEVKVDSVERSAGGIVCINGGLEAGGFDLVTDESGIFYETGLNDAKNWYEVGEATIRVSVDFRGHDYSDPNQGDVVLYPGSFLVDEVKNYDFTPFNTTIRVEDGQIVELTRVYVP